MSASFEREFDCSASFGRMTSGARVVRNVLFMAEMDRTFVCRALFVCSVDLDDTSLWASDQVVLTVDGGRVYVTRA